MACALRASAPGKVNLCLFLGPARADGRHELVTVFESLSVGDRLELSVLPQGSADEVLCPGVAGQNLAATALSALRERGWDGPAVRISIEKRLPVAAGMGGGSADAAATLRLAARVSPIAPEVLDEVARGLGADVPSQIRPGLWLGTGAGEILSEMAPLAGHALVVVPLEHQLSTAKVYAEADRLGLGRPALELAALRERIAELPAERPLPDDLLVNDLAPAAVSLCPAVGEALAAVQQAGADHRLVCGSGPTVAGIFWGAGAAGAARRALERLSRRYPRAVAAQPLGGAE